MLRRCVFLFGSLALCTIVACNVKKTPPEDDSVILVNPFDEGEFFGKLRSSGVVTLDGIGNLKVQVEEWEEGVMRPNPVARVIDARPGLFVKISLQPFGDDPTKANFSMVLRNYDHNGDSTITRPPGSGLPWDKPNERRTFDTRVLQLPHPQRVSREQSLAVWAFIGEREPALPADPNLSILDEAKRAPWAVVLTMLRVSE